MVVDSVVGGSVVVVGANPVVGLVAGGSGAGGSAAVARGRGVVEGGTPVVGSGVGDSAAVARAREVVEGGIPVVGLAVGGLAVVVRAQEVVEGGTPVVGSAVEEMAQRCHRTPCGMRSHQAEHSSHRCLQTGRSRMCTRTQSGMLALDSPVKEMTPPCQEWAGYVPTRAHNPTTGRQEDALQVYRNSCFCVQNTSVVVKTKLFLSSCSDASRLAGTWPSPHAIYALPHKKE